MFARGCALALAVASVVFHLALVFSGLTPNLVSAFIAVDVSSRQNGCLQVIRGSHLCGRVHHQLTGEQAGADPERVEQIMMPLGRRR